MLHDAMACGTQHLGGTPLRAHHGALGELLGVELEHLSKRAQGRQRRAPCQRVWVPPGLLS